MKELFDKWRVFARDEHSSAQNKKNILLENKLLNENRKGLKYSYSFGKIGGEIIDSHNPDIPMYGASMNKPILAFINLILAKRGELNTKTGEPIRALSDTELRALIDYKKYKVASGVNFGSNEVNKSLSNFGYNPKNRSEHKEHYKNLSRQIGIAHEQARGVLEELDLNQFLPGVRYGGEMRKDTTTGERKYFANNKQTATGYNKFFSVLLGQANDANSEHHQEALRVLNVVKLRSSKGGKAAGYVGRGLKRYLNKELAGRFGEDAIKSIYGKGGKVDGHLNYSIVINDKYVLTVYAAKKGMSANALRKQIRGITFEVLNNLDVEEFNAPSEIQTGGPGGPSTVQTPQLQKEPGQQYDVPDDESGLPEETPDVPEEEPLDATYPPEVDLPDKSYTTLSPNKPEEYVKQTPEEEENRGKFVGGFKSEDFRHPSGDDFDFKGFYEDLDSEFPGVCNDAGECGAAGMLPASGADYKFGKEHDAAYNRLKDKVVANTPIQEELISESLYNMIMESLK